jgi:transposase
VLAVSLELSAKSWKIALHAGKRDKPAIHAVEEDRASQRLAHAMAVIDQVKRK